MAKVPVTDKKIVSQDTPTKNSKTQKRTATAHWLGDFKKGKGSLSTQSETLEEINYSYKTRFEDGKFGTNPEELLAAAHAGCFTMSVAALLGVKKFTPTSLTTKATLTMKGLSIDAIHLAISGIVPGLTAKEFGAIIKEAEQTCIISKILKVTITSEANFIA